MCPTDGDLQSYLDGELEPAARDVLVQHLAGCGECRERVAAVGSRRARVARLIGAQVTPPSGESTNDALARFRARVAGAQPAASRRVAVLLAASCAAGVVLAAIAVLLFSHVETPALTPRHAGNGVQNIVPIAKDAAPQSRPVLTSSSGESRFGHEPAAARVHRRRARPMDAYLLLAGDVAAPEIGIVVRVRMPLSALAPQPVSEVRAGAEPQVEADVLVGQDGRARAIRFVNYTVSSGGK